MPQLTFDDLPDIKVQEKTKSSLTFDDIPKKQVIKPRPSVKDFLFTPISKQLTGKSLTERAGIVEKSQKELEALGTKRALEGKPPSTAEFFMRGLPAQTKETLLDFADITPADVGVMAGTAGAGKIPFKGVPLGEIATKIPITKRFFKDITEFGKYQSWLKMSTPLSSRGTTKATIPAITPKLTGEGIIKTPDFAENINLTKYPEDVRKTIYDLVSEKPEIGKTPKVSDKELIKMASELKGTPTIKMLADLPEGTIESEMLKLRQGNVSTIRTALAGELTELKNKLDGVISKDISLHRKTASMFGRGLRQQRLPAETSQDMAFAIDDTIKRVSKDPIFNKDKELLDTLKKLRAIVVDKEFNPTAWNKIYYAWINSILSNPFTHLVNTASNALFTAMKVPEKLASAIWDLPLSLKTEKRTQFFGEVPQMIKGAFSKEKLPMELAQGSKLEYMTQPIRGRLGKIIGTPTKLLQVEDNLAKSIVGKMELAGQRYAGKSGEELLSKVSEEQLYRTFQNDAGVVADTLQMIRGRIPFLRYVVPFIRTPANLIARGLERTPLGAVKVARGLVKKTYTQETLSKDLGNLTLGTLGLGWLGLEWAKGNITGRVPSNSALRDAFYRQGKKPNAIKIGNKWIPLERFEPIGTSFSVMANMFEDYKNSDKVAPPEKLMDAFTKLGSTLINKTYLSGFTQMVNALSNPEMYGENFLRRIVTGVEPQLLKFFADLKDPYYREANTILDQLKAKTPFLSEKLPPKLNVFGEPVKRDFLNIGTDNMNKLERMLKETPIGFPSKSLGKEKLTSQEYRYVLKNSGMNIKKILSNMSEKEFLKLPIEVREKVLTNIVSNLRKIYRGAVRMKRELQPPKK